jgi:hypothetical protein
MVIVLLAFLRLQLWEVPLHPAGEHQQEPL